MPAYQPTIHTTAKRELSRLQPEERNRLTDTIMDICQCESPTQHPAVKPLEGQKDLFRVRVGDLRAVGRLAKPEVRILKCGYRNAVYDGIDDIHERRETPA